jgi:predicted lipase
MKFQMTNDKFQINSKLPMKIIKVLAFKHLNFNWHLDFDICHYQCSLSLLSNIARRKK